MSPSANAQAGIEISAEEMENVQATIAMAELAIVLEGKGGFNMAEQKGQDFHDTLTSYMRAAVKGHQIEEYTMCQTTVTETRSTRSTTRPSL